MNVISSIFGFLAHLAVASQAQPTVGSWTCWCGGYSLGVGLEFAVAQDGRFVLTRDIYNAASERVGL